MANYGRLFTKEQHDFFVDNQKYKSAKEMAELMNDTFGLSVTDNQIRCYRRNHKIKSGNTGWFSKGQVPHNKGRKYPGTANTGSFRKGNTPHNYQPVGTIRYTTKGYPKRKIADPNVWEFCHRREWEDHNGPIPKGCVVAFLDGDKTNWDISNLILLDNAELGAMNNKKYFTADPELTKAGAGVVKLGKKMKEKMND